MRMSKAPVAEK